MTSLPGKSRDGSWKPGYSVLQELSRFGVFARVPPRLAPSELVAVLDGLASMKMQLTPKAGRMLRARVAEVAPDLTGQEVVRSIIAIANLQRALREDNRNWASGSLP